jgi:hypothetical protein
MSVLLAALLMTAGASAQGIKIPEQTIIQHTWMFRSGENAPPVLRTETIPFPFPADNPTLPGSGPVQTRPLVQMPFDHPAWEPTEEQKKAALLRAYHLNGDRMCCGFIELPEKNR